MQKEHPHAAVQVSKAFYALLEVLAHNHTPVVACCDTPTFAFLMSALELGLKSLDVSISSQVRCAPCRKR
jgi:exportin-7